MKKYFSKKRLLLFGLLFIITTALSLYLNAIGYKGLLYFQTVYDNDGYKSYGPYSPRTGGFLLTGLSFMYLSHSFYQFFKLKKSVIINRICGTFFIIGVTLLLLACLDLFYAFRFILNR